MRQAAHSLSEPASRQTLPYTSPGKTAANRRVYLLAMERSRRQPPPGFLSWVTDLGFNGLLLASPRFSGSHDIDPPPRFVEAAVAAGLDVHLDLILDIASETTATVRRHREWYRAPAHASADPRATPYPAGLRFLDLRGASDVEALAEATAARLRQFGKSGVGGYRCKPTVNVPPALWRLLTAALPETSFSLWTADAPAEAMLALPSGCFDIAYDRLARWDFAADWLGRELDRLGRVAPVASTRSGCRPPRSLDWTPSRRRGGCSRSRPASETA